MLLQQNDVESGALAVDARTGEVWRAGATLRITKRERALIAALALNGDRVPTRRLAELLYPDLDERLAANTIKVMVHRLRRRVCRSFIVSAAGTYGLGSSTVRVPQAMPRLILNGLARKGRPPAPPELEQIVEFARSLRKTSSIDLQCFDWYVALQEGYVRQGRDLALTLARNLLEHGDATRALGVARELAEEEPCDEEAWEVVVRAHLALGNRAAAIRDYLHYRTSLARELGAEPSHNLTLLVTATN